MVTTSCRKGAFKVAPTDFPYFPYKGIMHYFMQQIISGVRKRVEEESSKWASATDALGSGLGRSQ